MPKLLKKLEEQDLHYQIALTLLYGIGPRKAGHLISKLGGIEPIFKEKLTTLYKASVRFIFFNISLLNPDSL